MKNRGSSAMKVRSDVLPVRGRLLNFKEACAHLGMTDQHLRRLVAARKIPVLRDGRLGFYTNDLDEWTRTHTTPADGDTASVRGPLTPLSLTAPQGIEDLLEDARRAGSGFLHETATPTGRGGSTRRSQTKEQLHG